MTEATGSAIGTAKPERPAETGAATVDGRLDAVLDGRALGWAWRPSDPSERLPVVVAIDDRPVARGVADRSRASLAEAGIGDGAHAFVIALPASVGDGGTHAVRVMAGSGGTPLPAARGFSAGAGEAGPFSGTTFVPIDRQGLPHAPANVDGQGLPHAPAPIERLGRPAPRGPRGSPGPNAPRWLLAGGCALYFLLFIYLTRHFSFFQDEYAFILTRHDWSLGAFLRPYNQALSVVPVVVYKLLFVTVGLHTTWPYRLPVFMLHIACVWGVYVLAMRRAGVWIALVPAGLLLVLGAGFEDELWAFQMGFLGSLAAGLWALICLDRNDRRGDIGATVLVAVSLACSNIGLPFAAAIGVELALTRRRRLWVVGIPALLYVLWYAHYGQSDIVWANVPKVPGYDVQIAAYGFAGLVGLSTSTFAGTGTVGYILLAVTGVWLLRELVSHWPLPGRAIAGIVAALAFWTATALVRAQHHQPDASRYVYPSAMFILLAAIGFLRWRRVTVRAAGAIAVAGAVIAAIGLAPLRQYALARTSVDARVRVALGAAEVAGAAGDPTHLPDAHHLGFVTLGDYLNAVRALGSPAFTPGEIARQPPAYQLLADSRLIGAERIQAVRTAQQPTTGEPCAHLDSTASAPLLELSVDPGQQMLVVASPGSTVRLWLRRLSASFPPLPLQTLASGEIARLAFPHDASTIPWRVRVTGLPAPSAAGAGPLATVCVSRAEPPA